MKHENPDYLAIADLPPPTLGISIVSSWVVQFLKDRNAQTDVINTSAKAGFFYAIRRLNRFIFALFKVFRCNSQTSIYIALSHGQSLYAQTVILTISKWKSNRVIVHHHTFLPINRPKMLQNRICHGLMRKRVEHIFLSEYMKEKYQKTWKPSGKCWVVTNHQIASLRTESQTDKHKSALGNKLCFAGRLSKEKGFWDSESITRVLLTKYSDLTAIFLGPTSETDIFQAIEKLKKEFPLRFNHIGIYDEITLSQSLIDSTFFLFPSRYSNEASPLVVLEAQSLGNICITSDIGTLGTDVLSPGSAVDIELWHKKVLEIIEENSSDQSNARLVSEKIREKSASLALLCDKQMKEVFRL